MSEKNTPDANPAAPPQTGAPVDRVGGPFLDLPILKEEKRKKTKEDWNQLLWPLVDKEHPPKATRHLNRQVMCGACQFRCCNSEIFAVEVSQEELERYQKEGTLPADQPLWWPQSGRCFCLEENGCKFGETRPSFCKIYPVQIDFDRGNLYCPHWALTHCPTPKHFEFVGEVDGKFVYKKRADLKGPVKNNIQEEIRLDHKIEEWPTILEQNAEGLAEIYSKEMVEGVRNQLKILNDEDPKSGFKL